VRKRANKAGGEEERQCPEQRREEQQ